MISYEAEAKTPNKREEKKRAFNDDYGVNGAQTTTE